MGTGGKMEAYPDIVNTLEIGSEIDWHVEHLPSSAWLEHIPFAFWIVGALRPDNLVELGTHSGASYGAFCEAVVRLGLPTRCYAVDTWEGDAHAGLYDETVFRDLSAMNETRWRAFSSLLRTTFDNARAYFTDGSIDLLHIDGLHTYEAVRHDWLTWKDTLSRRSVVLFHDTNVREREFGVWRLFEELRQSYPFFEFHHGHGLGIVAVGADLPTPLRGLFAAGNDPVKSETIRRLFAARGASIRNAFLLEEARRKNDELTAALSLSNRREREAQQALAAANSHATTLVDPKLYIAEFERRIARESRIIKLRKQLQKARSEAAPMTRLVRMLSRSPSRKPRR
ncbi:MAG TPA: class I SAM-dependent methyltransferase [Bauldia sp.]|nr:class I SAM-dependent methyltransferase [Bauldia sp.]